MAPFLRDEGPPVSKETIQRARESLPLEFGHQIVNETGRETLLVRVPKAKPDYLHDLAEVAFYVGLDMIRNTKDILLIGHEKTARLEPQLLRDNIRAQAREDEGVVEHLRRQVDKQYGYTTVQSPSNHTHRALAMRIPKGSISEFNSDDVLALRQVLSNMKGKIEECQYAYIVAGQDFERLGRRTLLELLGVAPVMPAPAEPAAPPVSASPLVAATVQDAPPRVPQAGAAATAVAFPRGQFPPTPGPAPAAPAASAPIAPPAAPMPPAAPAPAALPPEVEEHEEYAIISRPKAPAAPPAPRAPLEPAAPALPQAAPAPATATEEYEVMGRAPAAPPAAAAAAAAMPEAPHVERQVEVFHEEYEVYTSKPKPKADTPAITPPGQGGFANAFSQAVAPPPAKTKEYEIMGRASAPVSAPVVPPAPPAASAPAASVSAPPAAHPAYSSTAPSVRDDPRFVTPRTTLPVPSADNGQPLLARTAPANPEGILAARFREAGYEVVEGLRAQGTVFAFAAHKPNGRRVLVKRQPDFGPEEGATLSQLLVALGADVGLVVVDRVLPGARLATWGTRIEIVHAADVPGLVF